MNAQEQKDHALKVKLEVFKHHQAEIEEKQKALRDLATQIVDAHCPYKVGARVLYSEWWQSGKMSTGVIAGKSVLNLDGKGIDGLWRVVIQRTKKDGSPHHGKHPIHLGSNKGDKLTLDSSL